MGAEAALVFSTGYPVNLGAIATLLSSGDAVIIDSAGHASILDAGRCARAPPPVPPQPAQQARVDG